MDMKSVSGFVHLVGDLDRTVEFYEALGFRPGKRDETSASVYLNWFWIEFRPADAASDPEASEATMPRLYIKVDDADDAHSKLISEGFVPVSEPAPSLNGRREFSLLDPDGHELVFFSRK